MKAKKTNNIYKQGARDFYFSFFICFYTLRLIEYITNFNIYEYQGFFKLLRIYILRFFGIL